MPAFSNANARDGMSWRGGALELGLLLHLLLPSLGADVLLKRYAGRPDLAEKMNAFIREVDHIPDDGCFTLPLKDLAPIKKLGLGLDTFEELISYPNDPFFSHPPYSPADFFPRIKIPVYHIGGWHDIFLNGTLQAFNTLRGNLPAGQSRLIVGPWSHTNYGNQIGELDFGMKANMAFIDGAMDLVALSARWFDRWLNGIQNGVEDEPPVKIFVMGNKTWRNEDEWPLQGTQFTPFYIHPDRDIETRNAAIRRVAGRLHLRSVQPDPHGGR